MLEVRFGRALSEWLGGCEPTVQSLRSMAEQVERTDLVSALDPLIAEMKRAKTAGAVIEGESREALLSAYEPLSKAIPKAFALDDERRRREPIIVRSTLLQIPGVEKVTLDKLQAAGVMNIEALSRADPEELAQAAGISAELAARIRDHFTAGHSGPSSLISAPSRSQELGQLGSLVTALEEKHREYEAAAQKWTREAKVKKRKARRQRAEALLRVHVSLARLGEIDRLITLDRLPFDRKIDTLTEYLRAEEARQKHG